MQDPRRFNLKSRLLWTAGFLAFPIAGFLAEALTGRINDFSSALLGGMVAGAVIGTGQWLVARRLLDAQTWIPATALAMGIGLNEHPTACHLWNRRDPWLDWIRRRLGFPAGDLRLSAHWWSGCSP